MKTRSIRASSVLRTWSSGSIRDQVPGRAAMPEPRKPARPEVPRRHCRTQLPIVWRDGARIGASTAATATIDDHRGIFVVAMATRSFPVDPRSGRRRGRPGVTSIGREVEFVHRLSPFATVSKNAQRTATTRALAGFRGAARIRLPPRRRRKSLPECHIHRHLQIPYCAGHTVRQIDRAAT
jgi:hypothetical protein